MLSDLCNIITEIPNTKIKIIGHTDNMEKNNTISYFLKIEQQQ